MKDHGKCLGFELLSSLAEAPKDEHRDAAFITACGQGKSIRVKELLQQFQNPDTSVCAGETGLHRAAENTAIGVVSLLLTAGAKVDAADDVGQRALHLAASGGHTEVATWS